MENYEITISKNENEKIELLMDSDSTIWEWGRIFRIILKWISFTEETIDKIILKEEELSNAG